MPAAINLQLLLLMLAPSASVSGRPGVIDARNFSHDAKN